MVHVSLLGEIGSIAPKGLDNTAQGYAAEGGVTLGLVFGP